MKHFIESWSQSYVNLSQPRTWFQWYFDGLNCHDAKSRTPVCISTHLPAPGNWPFFGQLDIFSASECDGMGIGCSIFWLLIYTHNNTLTSWGVVCTIDKSLILMYDLWNRVYIPDYLYWFIKRSMIFTFFVCEDWLTMCI